MIIRCIEFVATSQNFLRAILTRPSYFWNLWLARVAWLHESFVLSLFRLEVISWQQTMVQSINTKAIFTLASILRRPSLLIPHVSVDTVSQLDFPALRQQAGISAVIFDKDNTLTGPYEECIHGRSAKGLQNALDTFGSDHVAILSNSAGTKSDDPGYAKAVEIEEKLNVAVIRHEEKKPGGLQDVLDHFDIKDPAQICVVGDRVLTDVVFGNLHGMLTVHTLPLCKGKEENKRDNWTAKLIRPVENKLIYGRMGKFVLPSAKPHKYWRGPEECSLVLPEVEDSEPTDTT